MFSLLLPAALVPEGHTVYKATGSKPYTFRRSIKMYGEERQEITPASGLCFLVADGVINCIKNSTRLKVEFDSVWKLEEFADNFLHTHK